MKKMMVCLVLMLAWFGSAWAYQNEAQLAELRVKAAAGNPQAQAELADYYANVYEDANRQADYSQALTLYEQAAEQGEAYSQVTLAHLYHAGEQIPQDLERAFHWAEISAKAGINDTQILLAQMYRNGEGVAEDLGLAYLWYSVALQRAHDERKPQLAKDLAEVEQRLTAEQIAAAQKAAEQYK